MIVYYSNLLTALLEYPDLVHNYYYCGGWGLSNIPQSAIATANVDGSIFANFVFINKSAATHWPGLACYCQLQ